MDLKVLYKIGYGMYVVCSKLEKEDTIKFNGQIANTVFQITSEPPTIAVCINRQNLTYEYIKTSRVFTVSILKQDTPLKFIGQFGFKSGRDIDKFSGINYKTGITGAPVVIDNSIGYLEAEVINSIDLQTHTLFIGKVIALENISNEEPMTYAYYHLVKQGKSPKTAPTYIKEDNQKEEKTTMGQEKYKCKICGYIYDPEKGDPDSNIPAGTPFEKLPEDWVCPVCGAGKEEFELVK